MKTIDRANETCVQEARRRPPFLLFPQASEVETLATSCTQSFPDLLQLQLESRGSPHDHASSSNVPESYNFLVRISLINTPCFLFLSFTCITHHPAPANLHTRTKDRREKEESANGENQGRRKVDVNLTLSFLPAPSLLLQLLSSFSPPDRIPTRIVVRESRES